MKKICIVLMLMLIFTGCSSRSVSNESVTADVAPEMAEAPLEAASEEMIAPSALMGEKLIREVNLDVNTLNYDKDLKSFLDEVEKVQGVMTDFSEDVYDHYKNYHGTARIPKDALDAFLEQMDALFPKKSINMNTQDVTSQYVDLEGRIANLKAREERLREMMGEAEDTETLLMIDKELSNVTYEIESLTGEKMGLDERIDFATVYFGLYEEAGATPVDSEDFFSSLMRNIKEGFVGFFVGIQGFILFLAKSLPVIILVALILLGLRAWSKKTGRTLLPRRREIPPKDKE